MYSGTINSNKNLTHKPRFIQGLLDSEIVVFVHGFMGSPRQYDSLADGVHLQGFSYVTLLLPGHGGTVKDFSKSRYLKWQKHVDDEILKLSSDYRKIWLVGHSMGSLLAINTAIKYPDLVCGVFTIACPLKVTYLSLPSLRIQLIKMFAKKSNPIRKAYISYSSVPRTPSLAWHIHRPDFEFLKLQYNTKKALHKITQPIVSVFSVNDEVTSIKSLDIMQSQLKNHDFKAVLLYDSLHALYTKSDQIKLEQELIKFLTRS